MVLGGLLHVERSLNHIGDLVRSSTTAAASKVERRASQGCALHSATSNRRQIAPPLSADIATRARYMHDGGRLAVPLASPSHLWTDCTQRRDPDSLASEIGAVRNDARGTFGQLPMKNRTFASL